jgi:flagellar hook-length control protein FliK
MAPALVVTDAPTELAAPVTVTFSLPSEPAMTGAMTGAMTDALASMPAEALRQAPAMPNAGPTQDALLQAGRPQAILAHDVPLGLAEVAPMATVPPADLTADVAPAPIPPPSTTQPVPAPAQAESVAPSVVDVPLIGLSLPRAAPEAGVPSPGSPQSLPSPTEGPAPAPVQAMGAIAPRPQDPPAALAQPAALPPRDSPMQRLLQALRPLAPQALPQAKLTAGHADEKPQSPVALPTIAEPLPKVAPLSTLPSAGVAHPRAVQLPPLEPVAPQALSGQVAPATTAPPATVVAQVAPGGMAPEVLADTAPAPAQPAQALAPDSGPFTPSPLARVATSVAPQVLPADPAGLGMIGTPPAAGALPAVVPQAASAERPIGPDPVRRGQGRPDRMARAPGAAVPEPEARRNVAPQRVTGELPAPTPPAPTPPAAVKEPALPDQAPPVEQPPPLAAVPTNDRPADAPAAHATAPVTASAATAAPLQAAAASGLTRKAVETARDFAPRLVRRIAETGQSKSEIVLEPAELGKLRFELVTKGDRVEVNMTAERPETLDLLRNHVAELRQEFRAAGLDTGAMNFGQWGQGPRDDRGFAQMTEDGAEPGFETAAPLLSPLPPERRAVAGGLDLRL